MTLPAWPSGVTYRPERQGWSQKDGQAPASTEFQFGISRMRRTSRARLTEQQVSLFLPAVQISDFNTFIETTTAGATSRFTMSVWDGAAYVTRNVQIKGGEGGVSRQSVGTGQRVAFTLMIEDL